MLRQNQAEIPHRSFHHFSSTPTPFDMTHTPSMIAPENVLTDNPQTHTDTSNLLIAQLNCFNGKNVVESILADERYAVILLQEPWINPHTLDLLKHPAWHDITPYDYKATNYTEKTRTGIYISKRIPSWLITILPSRSPLLTAVEITLQAGLIPKLRVLSVYNPPRHHTGIPVLKEWLTTNNDRRIATVISMDANLHHRNWNPTTYHHTHTQSRELIRVCGSAGFKISSQKGVPTFYSKSGQSATTIDLTWVNHKLSKFGIISSTTDDSHGSDHQVLTTEIRTGDSIPNPIHSSASLEKMGKASFHEDVEDQLSVFPIEIDSREEIDAAVEFVTDTIRGAFLRQGKIVKTKPHRHKAWWDEEKLRRPIQERNRARRWMIISRTADAKKCYWEWDDYVKRLINELKRHHWRAFLAKAHGNLSFKAFSYTAPHGSNTVAPLYRRDKTLATDKNEQAKLLFLGTSVVHNECDDSDIPPTHTQTGPLPFPSLTEYEIEEILGKLPSKRAKGEDGIPNELLKLAKSLLAPKMKSIFNACLKYGYFPTTWKTAMTAILRKQDKDDYSEAGAYRPIALLSCLGKVLETVIARRLAYWAETHKIIAQGHMGGRRQHSTDDAFVILTSWIHSKWREGKIVSGLFLDVKSAYPSVNRHQLTHILNQKGCPAYLTQQIESYLEDRTTKLRLQDFISDDFHIQDGLPQGSPLSVMLYIIYNSSLLIQSNINLQSSKISIGFIDDVNHLVANKDIDMNVLELEEEGDRSLEWGRRHGAIFDKKKAQLMHFTHRKHNDPALEFGDQVIQPRKTELQWLGLWLDPKLTFNAHIGKLQQRGKATLAQINRISRCYHGLSPKETKHLLIAVLKPRILFGSIVWYNGKSERKVTKILHLIQNAANRLALGAFKSSPTEQLDHDANMISFKELAIRQNHNFVYKRLTAPGSHPTKQILLAELAQVPLRHQSPLHTILNKTDLILPFDKRLETIHPYPDPPWIEQQGIVENVGVDRKDAKERIPRQVEEEIGKRACVMFTDGSFIPEVGGGAAVAMKDLAAAHAYGPKEGISNYEMEVMAIMIALVQFRKLHNDNPGKYEALAIFSDSQAALDLFTKPVQPKTLQYLARFLRKSYSRIPKDIRVSLYWTPGHEDIELNEKADEAAKAAAEEGIEPLTLPVGLGSLLQHSRKTFNKREAVSKTPFKTKGRWIADALNQLEKGHAAAIFQLRCGHCPLRKFLHQIGVEDSEKCDVCSAVETPAHFLIYCKNYTTQQRAFRQQLKEEEIKVNTNSAAALLDTPKIFPFLATFIQETGRFHHLKTYLEH